MRLIEEAAGEGSRHFARRAAWSQARPRLSGEGPTFLIEFVNVQPDAEGNPANHIHCVWRDRHRRLRPAGTIAVTT